MRNWLIGIGFTLLLAASGGIVYKLFFQPTNRTVIGRGGKQVIINTEVPKTPLLNFGCANLQAELAWRRNRVLNIEGETKKSKTLTDPAKNAD